MLRSYILSHFADFCRPVVITISIQNTAYHLHDNFIQYFPFAMHSSILDADLMSWVLFVQNIVSSRRDVYNLI